MANNKSAVKRVKTHERNRMRNRVARTSLRSQIKRFRTAVASGDAAAAASELKAAHSLIDVTAKKVIIHSKTASRYKSRLSLACDRMSA